MRHASPFLIILGALVLLILTLVLAITWSGTDGTRTAGTDVTEAAEDVPAAAKTGMNQGNIGDAVTREEINASSLKQAETPAAEPDIPDLPEDPQKALMVVLDQCVKNLYFTEYWKTVEDPTPGQGRIGYIGDLAQSLADRGFTPTQFCSLNREKQSELLLGVRGLKETYHLEIRGLLGPDVMDMERFDEARDRYWAGVENLLDSILGPAGPFQEATECASSGASSG